MAEKKKAVKQPGVDIATMQQEVHALLKLCTFEPEQRYWLDTGSEKLNTVLGSKERGLSYGTMIELSGVEHGGKSLISFILAALAQQDGAAVGGVDLEDSRDRRWCEKLGMDYDSVYWIYPRLIAARKKKKANWKEKKSKDEPKADDAAPNLRLQAAEELFAEMESAIKAFSARGFVKQLWFVDSVANIQTEMEVEAGVMGQNMRTANDRPLFLSRFLPRLAGLAANYNVLVVLVNQLREKPNMMFGDPTYTPGGRALRHNCKIRARVARMKGGRLKQLGKVVGLVGIVRNTKNKCGEGSVEGEECGFRVIWNKPEAAIRFMPAPQAEKLLEGKD